MNNLKYYIMYWDVNRTLSGPMTLRRALQVQEGAVTPCEILKKVIDVNGKEVK